MKLRGLVITLVSAWIAGVGVAHAQPETPYGFGPINVAANAGWVDTGADLAVGDGLFIVAKGTAVGSALVPGMFQQYLGPDGQGGNCGDPYRPLQSAAYLSLIGKIGTSGVPFFVGEVNHLQAVAAGRLYLSVNDGYPDDNQGGFVAYLHVQGLPAGGGDFQAPYLSAIPVIDGVVTPEEWLGESVYDVEFVDGSGNRREVALHLGTDFSFLYIGLVTPFASGWDVYATVQLDGNHNGLADGSPSEPHGDIGYGRTSPSGWSGYNFYKYIRNCDHTYVSAPAGAQSASSGNPTSYEFRIPLSDLGAMPASVGLAVYIGTVGTPQGNYGYPFFNPLHVSGAWKTVVIGASNVAGDGGPSARPFATRPNPSSGRTTLTYHLPEPGVASIRIFDVSGRLVRTLPSGHLPAGNHETVWGGEDDSGRLAPNGVYFLRLTTPGGMEEKKVVLQR